MRTLAIPGNGGALDGHVCRIGTLKPEMATLHGIGILKLGHRHIGSYCAAIRQQASGINVRFADLQPVKMLRNGRMAALGKLQRSNRSLAERQVWAGTA